MIIKGHQIPDYADKMAAAEAFLGGGTNFETPMWESLRLMQEDGFENADIVFISDGESLVDLPGQEHICLYMFYIK